MFRGRCGVPALSGSLAAVMFWSSAVAVAQEPAPTVLPPIVVAAPPLSSSSSEQLIPGKDFELRPEGRPADVLRLVPGLIISQHQGGGKAEQYLIRGFDADHGTDIALFVDDLEAFLSIENLTNAHWRESQFFFTSRLPSEPAGGVGDIHFTPGNPRSFLGGIAVHF